MAMPKAIPIIIQQIIALAISFFIFYTTHVSIPLTIRKWAGKTITMFFTAHAQNKNITLILCILKRLFIYLVKSWIVTLSRYISHRYISSISPFPYQFNQIPCRQFNDYTKRLLFSQLALAKYIVPCFYYFACFHFPTNLSKILSLIFEQRRFHRQDTHNQDTGR